MSEIPFDSTDQRYLREVARDLADEALALAAEGDEVAADVCDRQAVRLSAIANRFDEADETAPERALHAIYDAWKLLEAEAAATNNPMYAGAERAILRGQLDAAEYLSKKQPASTPEPQDAKETTE